MNLALAYGRKELIESRLNPELHYFTIGQLFFLKGSMGINQGDIGLGG